MLSAMTSGKKRPGSAGRSPRRAATHGAGLSSQRLRQGADLAQPGAGGASRARSDKQDLRRQVARLLRPGPGQDRELKVFSDGDWTLMTTDPRPALKCFEPTCDQRLSAVNAPDRARHLRVLNPKGKDKGEREEGCPHIHPLASAGGTGNQTVHGGGSGSGSGGGVGGGGG